jgi:hypothetical protein
VKQFRHRPPGQPCHVRASPNTNKPHSYKNTHLYMSISIFLQILPLVFKRCYLLYYHQMTWCTLIDRQRYKCEKGHKSQMVWKGDFCCFHRRSLERGSPQAHKSYKSSPYNPSRLNPQRPIIRPPHKVSNKASQTSSLDLWRELVFVSMVEIDFGGK